MLLGAWRDGELLGYACLYWHFDSLRAEETVLLNDLYVIESARGQGVGRALIEASAKIARERGARTCTGSPPRTTARPAASTTRPAPPASPRSSTSCGSDGSFRWEFMPLYGG